VSYSSIEEMAGSESLRGRITAAAAVEGVDNPTQWIYSAIWSIAASPNWATQWDYAKGTYQVNANPDLGARTDVISDADILAAVQASQS
jgi:hypothetical protein